MFMLSFHHGRPVIILVSLHIYNKKNVMWGRKADVRLGRADFGQQKHNDGKSGTSLFGSSDRKSRRSGGAAPRHPWVLSYSGATGDRYDPEFFYDETYDVHYEHDE